MKQIFYTILLASLLSGCYAQLKGPQVEPNPELTGFYVDESEPEVSEDKIKRRYLAIFPGAKENSLRYKLITVIRMSFHISDDREEVKVREGTILSSDTELLFREHSMKQFNKTLIPEERPWNPKDWKLSDLGPAAKIRDVSKSPPSGADKVAFASKDFQTIQFEDQKFKKVSQSFLGRIKTQSATLDNLYAGAVYSISEDGSIQVVMSQTDGLGKGIPVTIQSDGKTLRSSISEIDEFMVTVKKPKDNGAPIAEGSPILLVGNYDKKAKQTSQKAQSLIEKIKNNPNMTKEEIIRSLEEQSKK